MKSNTFGITKFSFDKILSVNIYSMLQAQYPTKFIKKFPEGRMRVEV